MSRASGNDGVPSTDVRGIPAAESVIATRRRALKAMLGSAPVVLTFPSVTAAASSSTCQYELDKAKASAPPDPISDTNMSLPSWFRLVVTKQVYDPGGTLYKYEGWYYDPADGYAKSDTPPPAYLPENLKSETPVYVLADISKSPFEPDFTGTGFNSTLSCMASMP